MCVSFIKRRATVEEERKRDDPWLGSRGEMKKRRGGGKLRERKKRDEEGRRVAQFLF